MYYLAYGSNIAQARILERIEDKRGRFPSLLNRKPLKDNRNEETYLD